MGFSVLEVSTSATPCSSPNSRGEPSLLHVCTPILCTLISICRAITCLLEDILVSVLMLLVSVTTIAEGKREVWEYWGGSCLCVYTAERRETSSRHGKGQSSRVLRYSRSQGCCMVMSIVGTWMR